MPQANKKIKWQRSSRLLRPILRLKFGLDGTKHLPKIASLISKGFFYGAIISIGALPPLCNEIKNVFLDRWFPLF